jgi:hypothetical protein
MMTVKAGKKEYKIKFAYIPTVKARILSKIQKYSDLNDEDGELNFEKLEDLLSFIPEVLLAGLQYYHKDKFGYDYDTGEGKAEKLSEVYSIMDDYFDGEEADFLKLFNDLQEEMLKNGFLAVLFRKMNEEQTEQ